MVETGSDPDSCRSRESNWRLGRPGESQGGPNKGHLDPKISKKIKLRIPPGKGINTEFRWVETGFPQIEGVKPEVREAKRGPKRAK